MFYENADDCCLGYFGNSCSIINACESNSSEITSTTTSGTALTASPTRKPTNSPVKAPSTLPTMSPTPDPTNAPTNLPSTFPTNSPTRNPTNSPVNTKWYAITDTNGKRKCTDDNPSDHGYSDLNGIQAFDTNEDCCVQFNWQQDNYCYSQMANPPTQKPTTAPSALPTMSPTPEPTNPPTYQPTIKPTVYEPFTDMVHGYDSFESYYSSNENLAQIPWIYGSPKEWVIDDSKVLAGNKSIRNVQPIGAGAASTMSLKINVSSWAIIRCIGLVDVSMPWDMFYVSVNGEERINFYTPSDEWVTLVTGLSPGENIIHFTVKNNDISTMAQRDSPDDGTGFVWLDSCDISPS